jgi:hypothetical protein
VWRRRTNYWRRWCRHRNRGERVESHGEVSRTVGNHATNPFFSENPFDTTTCEHHNNPPWVPIVLWASLGFESGPEMEEWPLIFHFHFVDPCWVCEGSMSRWQAVLNFRSQKCNNLILITHQASDTFVVRVWGL